MPPGLLAFDVFNHLIHLARPVGNLCLLGNYRFDELLFFFFPLTRIQPKNTLGGTTYGVTAFLCPLPLGTRDWASLVSQRLSLHPEAD